MKTVVVDIAGLGFSRALDSVVVTYALGSCVAVTAYDPVLRIGGMVHYMLPSASGARDSERIGPAGYGDIGVPLLFEGMYARGCRKRDLVVCAVGGAQVQDPNGVFNIGRRNYVMLRKLFWKNGVVVSGEDVGGAHSRTVRLEVATGRVTVKRYDDELEIWSGCDAGDAEARET